MLYISAGHNPNGIKTDSGAVGNGKRECDLTVEFRNLVLDQLKAKVALYISDNDSETLGQYLKRAETGNGSVVLEFHFDASANSKATGATALVGVDADDNDKAFARDILYATVSTFGIKNRGVLSEADSHRGRLGLMREKGIVALLELCFISNPDDLKAYDLHKTELAGKIADILIKYDALI